MLPGVSVISQFFFLSCPHLPRSPNSKYQEMDQGGVKSGTERDERLITLDYSENPAKGALQNGALGAMSLAPTSLVPPSSPLMQPVSGDVPNGFGNSTPPDEYTTAVTTSLGLYEEETAEHKVTGKDMRVQQGLQHQPLSLFATGENFSRLEASIADLNRSSPSMDSLIGGADPSLFHLKTEDFSPMDKGDIDMDQDAFSPMAKDVDVGHHKLFNDNTLDLLQDFELTGSPSDFYVGDDAFLSSLAEDSLLSDMSTDRDPKPASILGSGTGVGGGGGGGGGIGVGSSGNAIASATSGSLVVNGTRTGPLFSSPPSTSPVAVSSSSSSGIGSAPSTPAISPALVKVEKDTAVLQLSTPGVIKQEKASGVAGRSYCQVGSGAVTLATPAAISICGVSTSSGQSYHFGGTANVAATSSATASSPQPKEEKVFSLYPALGPAAVDTWNRARTGFGDAGQKQRAGDGLSVSQGFSPTNYVR